MSLRVFAPTGSAPAAGGPLLLDSDESRYLRRVRRARDGAQIELLDGAGGLWAAIVLADEGRRTKIQVGDPVPTPTIRRRLTLLLGLPEPSAALQTLSQATELGVATIVLLRCARSQGRPPTPERLHRVLRSAQRQCGRPTPPTILRATSLAEALEIDAHAPGFFADADLRGATEKSALPTPVDAARLLVGPEGGLTEDETTAARGRGWSPLGLGPWILRTETAALVGLSRLLFAPA